MRYSYWVESDALWVWDNSMNAATWHGKPDSESVMAVLAIPDQDDCIVLLNYHAGLGSQMYGLPRNLARIRLDGTIAWQQGGPDLAAADPFTAFQWFGAELIGFCSSYYSCVLDVETGKIISSVFTK